MRKLLSIILSVLMIVSTFAVVPTIAQAKDYDNRIEANFNHDWQFFRETYSGESKTTIDKIEGIVGDDWRDITLPHDFSIEGQFSTYATNNRSGCLQGGTGWYKKSFQIPTELSDKRFVINFDGVYSYSYVYVNGEYVGENRLGYVCYALDITDYLDENGKSQFKFGTVFQEYLAEGNANVTDAAIDYIQKESPDFSFVYLGWTDEAGHKHGWMSDEYMRAMDGSWKQIQRIRDILTEEYTLIVIADHGGHDRTHGTDMPEDMTIPVLIEGKDFEAGKELPEVSIKDIAPTIAALVGVEADDEWEGKSLLQR